VEQAAAEWISAGRLEYYLWDDKRLRLTTALATLGMSRNSATPPTVELDDEARAFLDAPPSASPLPKRVNGVAAPARSPCSRPWCCW
jgi:hypothetical protein